ncbi:MAG: serine protease Do [Acetobacteraceae bacterium]|nr:serine protease Do [Acetobacteraceae bacterium]
MTVALETLECALQPVVTQMQRLIGLVFVLIGAICSGAPAFGRAMDSSEAAILRQVAPAVVSISVWKMRASDQPGEPARRVKTYGSGFIVDPSGIIVTNQHVIDKAIDVKAVLIDGTRASAKVIDASPMTDLAVLKIEVGHPLPTLAWGDSDTLQVGDPVLTLGNGLGLGTSVSAGIVSGLNRNFADSPFDSYIQTDAVINHGNSGGPLIDHDGKVVGVSEALFNPEAMGGFIGVGLAIPTTIAKFVTDRLLDPHHPAPGWLGFSLQDVTPELAEPLGAPRSMGAVISAVEPSGPASRASLQPGDVLDQVNGLKLNDSRAFMRAIAMQPPGDVVHLATWRNGQKQEISATVAGWPNYKPDGGVMTGQVVAEMMTRPPDLGVKLAALDDIKRKQYGLGPEVSGVLVAHVEIDSEASDLGIKEGDVVMVVQGAHVITPDDVRRAVRDAEEQHRAWLAVLIRSKSGAQWIPISVGGKSS